MMYKVCFWRNGAVSVNELFDTKAEAQAAAIDFVDNEMNQHNMMRRGGYKRVGNIRRDMSLSWEHPAFGSDCGAIMKKHEPKVRWK